MEYVTPALVVAVGLTLWRTLKRDLESAEMRLKGDMTDLKGDMRDLRGDMGDLRGELKEVEKRLTEDLRHTEKRLKEDLRDTEKRLKNTLQDTEKRLREDGAKAHAEIGNRIDRLTERFDRHLEDHPRAPAAAESADT